MNRLGQAAHAYAAKGIAVFPLMAREKKPYPYSTGLKAASASLELVDAWWAGRAEIPKAGDAKSGRPIMARTDSNIGIATGSSAGFWVLDVDGPEGASALAALEALHGQLPRTAEQITARGRHICFAWPDPSVLGFEMRNSASKLGDKLDIRAAGGYIVAAPSLHPGDPDKGVAPGFEYRWAEGLSPWSVGFAAAPDWLLGLIREISVAAAPVPSRPVVRRKVEDGRATPYGEKALSNACDTIRAAGPGTQNETVFWRTYGVGRLVGAGEIERGYAERELINAGMAMVAVRGKAPTLKGISGAVRRAIERGEGRPADRHDRRQAAPVKAAEPRPAQTPGDRAIEIRDARGLWDAARPAQCSPVMQWLADRGLGLADLPDALDGLRVHAAAPWGHGNSGPSLLAPLVKRKGDPVDALAVLALHEDCERFCHFLGETEGRAVLLSGWKWDVLPILVAIDLQDGWALGAAAKRGGEPHRVAIAPTLASFAGGIMGDRFGRVDPDTPCADPAAPPWRMRTSGVVLAMRRDLRTPEFKVRGPGGRSVRRSVEGADAGRFWGSVAEQHWREAGANVVRILQSRSAAGFNCHE